MAIFGRNSARQRLRRAADESLRIPAFSTQLVDCAAWVTGGLWPAELSVVTVETAPLVKCLKADLARIVNSANSEIATIRGSGLPDSDQRAQEARVIRAARAFAVSRVDSSVRHLRGLTTRSPAPPPPRDDAAATTQRFSIAPPRPQHPGAAEIPTAALDVSPAGDPDERDCAPNQAPRDAAPAPAPPSAVELIPPDPPTDAVPDPADSDETTEIVIAGESARADTAAEPAEPTPRNPATDAVPDPPNLLGPNDTEARAEPVTAPPDVPDEPDPPPEPPASTLEPATGELATALHALAPRSETEPDRLARLLAFVTRQEPGLRWAVGIRVDDTAVLATDLAHGWIPPGITLPADVALVAPGRRTGTATALLGPITNSATYLPGDDPGWSADYPDTATSTRPRALPSVERPARALSEATHWRDGLPRMVNTLAKAGAHGTGVAPAELAILRTHLDTAQYQLLAQYPDVDAALLLNCLLLAATVAVAGGDWLSANYHLAWYQELSESSTD